MLLYDAVICDQFGECSCRSAYEGGRLTVEVETILSIFCDEAGDECAQLQAHIMNVQRLFS